MALREKWSRVPLVIEPALGTLFLEIKNPHSYADFKLHLARERRAWSAHWVQAVGAEKQDLPFSGWASNSTTCRLKALFSACHKQAWLINVPCLLVNLSPLTASSQIVMRKRQRLKYPQPMNLPHTERNQAILDAYQRGETLVRIAAAFDISIARVHQIVTKQ